MKAVLITCLLLLPTSALNAQSKVEACVKNHNAPPVNAYYWPPDTTVKVYFARGMFTDEQRVTLLNAMETWSDSRTILESSSIERGRATLRTWVRLS